MQSKGAVLVFLFVRFWLEGFHARDQKWISQATLFSPVTVPCASRPYPGTLSRCLVADWRASFWTLSCKRRFFTSSTVPYAFRLFLAHGLDVLWHIDVPLSGLLPPGTMFLAFSVLRFWGFQDFGACDVRNQEWNQTALLFSLISAPYFSSL